MAVATDTSTWNYASGWAAVLESRMARPALFERIIGTGDLSGILGLLGGTPLAERLNPGDDLGEADPAIDAAYRGLIERVRAVCPDPLVADLLLWRRELRSLKNFLKRRLLEMEVSEVPSRYGDAVWERLWRDLQLEVPDVFRRVMAAVRPTLEEARGRPELLDAAYDDASLGALCREAEKTDAEFIAQYFRRHDSVRGVECLWRARQMGLEDDVREAFVRGRCNADLFATLRRSEEERWPGIISHALEGIGLASDHTGPEGIAAFVREADRWQMRYAREARLVAFGPERVFGCLLGLEAEAANMRLAIVGRANNMDSDRLRSHLRATFPGGGAGDGR